MCIVCRKRRSKEEFLRIVKNNSGELLIDSTYKAPGRGAYVCRNRECILNALKKRALNRAYKCSVPEKIYEKLKEAIEFREYE